MGQSSPLESSPEHAELKELLRRHHAADPAARRKLVEWVDRWQRDRVSAALNGFPAVRRWHQSGDVLNDLLIRIYEELADWRPATAGEFLSRVGRWVRNRLVDLWRNGYGPSGQAAHYQSFPRATGGGDACFAVADGPPGGGADPARSAESAEMNHLLMEKLSRLPAAQREAVELRFWQAMTCPQIAAGDGHSARPGEPVAEPCPH